MVHVSVAVIISSASFGEDVLDLGSGPATTRPVCLVGKLCSQKVVNVFALMEVMKKAFRSKGKLSVRDWGSGLLIFTFELEEDRLWVLRNQPWHLRGSFLLSSYCLVSSNHLLFLF